MRAEDYEYLSTLEKDLWWFMGMRNITAALLDPFCPADRDREILDAGCGTGGNITWLRRYAGKGEVFGVDVTNDALQFCVRRKQPLLACASVTSLPFASAQFDLVTSFDVLAQLSNEEGKAAVCEMFRVLNPGGVIFVRTAAYEWMRSSHDEALSTQCRYNLPVLRSLLTGAGFRLLRASYANTFLLPVAAVRRLVLKPIGLADSGSDVKPLARGLQWMNGVLHSVLNAEANWIRFARLNLPVGLSAICVAQKPASRA